MTPWVLVTAIGGVLAVMAVAGLRSQGVLRMLILAQVAYWAISYVARPAVLLIVRPASVYADGIADSRLGADGYTASMTRVLTPVLIGLSIYTALVVFGARRFSGAQASSSGNRLAARTESPDFIRVLIWTFALGTLFRFLFLLGSDGAISQTLLYLGTAGATGIIVFYRSRSRTRTNLVVSLILLSELWWSIESVSKTPILAALLAVGLRLSFAPPTRKTLGIFIALGLIVVAGFSTLQGFKLSSAVTAAIDGADSQYPGYMAPFLSVIRRFDQFSAVTDAVTLGPRNWISLEEFTERAVEGAIPSVQSTKLSAGTLWATEVRGFSRPDTVADVSLAEGFIAEGYALDGYPGVLFEALYLFMLLLLVTKLLTSKHILLVVWGLLLMAFPILFERGILGGIEVASKSLQAVAIVWLISVAVKAFGLGGGRSASAPVPGLHAIAPATGRSGSRAL